MAVTFGAGGLVAVNAAGGVDSTTVLTDPVRVLDTRDPVNVGLPGPFESQSPQKLKITGSIPTTTGTKTVVPNGATGVLLNVTAVAPEADGFISIRPGDATGSPTTSSLNVTVGEVLANAVLVALPTSGTNAGQIDITWDAYGFLEPRTDILIDVVGYTNNSTLAALQTEIDAVEAANATQQTQIDAKADAADVSAALLDQRSFTAEVGSNGTKLGTGNFTSSRSSTGQYDVSFDISGLDYSGSFWNAVATARPSGCGASITGRSTTSSGGVLSAVGFSVNTYDAAGATDCAFFLFVQAPGPDTVTPPLALAGAEGLDMPAPAMSGVCTTEGEITTCVDQP